MEGTHDNIGNNFGLFEIFYHLFYVWDCTMHSEFCKSPQVKLSVLKIERATLTVQSINTHV